MSIYYIKHLKKMQYHATKLHFLMTQVKDNWAIDRLIIRSLLSSIQDEIDDCYKELITNENLEVE